MQQFDTTIINGLTYKVVISKKNVKNINYRLVNNEFHISCNYLCTKKYVMSCLDKIGPSLIKRAKKPRQLICDSFYYLFGQKFDNTHIFIFENIQYHFSSEEDFYKKIKKPFLEYLKKKVKNCRDIMNITENLKVNTRKMSTRYGSYSTRSKSLDFNLTLVHYSEDIINSVIIHELAHYFVYNHSKKFYDVVYKYCPNYDLLDKELKNKYGNSH